MTAQLVKLEPAESPGQQTNTKVSRAAVLIAWLLWALIMVFVVTSLDLNWVKYYWYVLSHPHLIYAATLEEAIGTILGYVAIPAYATVGAVVASLRPKNGVGWLCLGLAWTFVLGEVAWQLQARLLGMASFLESLSNLTWSLLVPPLPVTLMLLIFPTGRLLSRRWRFVVWMALAGTGYTAVAGLSKTYAGVIVPDTVGLWVSLAALLASVVAVVFRWRRSEGRERQQIKWLVYAVVVTIIAVLFTVVSWFIGDDVRGATSYPTMLATAVALAGVDVGIPVAIGVAVLRHRLYDIDRIINRTIVYGALTVIVVCAYVVVVGSLGMLFQTGVGGNLFVSILATGFIAILLQPLHRRLQRSVNHLMYGERDDPYAVLSRLGRRLEGTLAPEEALSTIVETVTQALKLPYAAITLRQDGKFVTVAEHGTPVGEPVILPLVYHTEEVGRLVVAPRTPGEAFASADRQLLDDLAHQAGAAAHAARLTADLRRSRERLVTAREEERRRLRRDLHDGLGPTLGALTIGLDTARSMVAEKPAAEELLARLKEESQEAVADVRRLVYGLRPPALDDLGLVAAIHQQAAKHGQVATGDPPQLEGANRKGGMVFTVEMADDLPPLPAAVEVATYRIAQEAMANAARHARARSCRVCLSVDEAAWALELRVIDDGVGIPEDHRAGVGMTSMRERAEELGGTLTVERLQEGGTCVLARLPLPTEEE